MRRSPAVLSRARRLAGGGRCLGCGRNGSAVAGDAREAGRTPRSTRRTLAPGRQGSDRAFVLVPRRRQPSSQLKQGVSNRWQREGCGRAFSWTELAVFTVSVVALQSTGLVDEHLAPAAAARELALTPWSSGPGGGKLRDAASAVSRHRARRCRRRRPSANEQLKAAMNRAGLDADQLAQQVGVDAKTVLRWLSGHVPHPRIRLLDRYRPSLRTARAVARGRPTTPTPRHRPRNHRELPERRTPWGTRLAGDAHRRRGAD